jgi:glycosyltransferase involved in cell wall biosynthesis
MAFNLHCINQFRMRIAQVSPLFESVPPEGYGGTERVVSYLTEELVRRGHRVTLFATADSSTSAQLVPVCRRSLRRDRRVTDSLAYHYLALESVVQLRKQFDVIHFHIDYLHFPISRHYGLRQLTTLHGRLDLPELQPLYAEYRDMPLVSISDAQRTPLATAHWVSTVHHGLPLDLYQFHAQAGDYVAFLGRTSPEKGLHTAIEIARRARLPLKIAAKVDRVDQQYFDTEIAPAIKDGDVEFLGEIDQEGKRAFLGYAKALLAPVDWPEPFGLVLIEAMACGTPVIAFGRGSIPEIIEDGVTGFIVENLDQAVDAVSKVDEISRSGCRSRFEGRFSAERMTDDYERAYEEVLAADGQTALAG